MLYSSLESIAFCPLTSLLYGNVCHVHIVSSDFTCLTVELDLHTDFYPVESPWHTLPPGSVISFCFSSRFPLSVWGLLPCLSHFFHCLLCPTSSLVTCTDPSSPARGSELGHILRPESSFPVPLLMGSVHAPPRIKYIWLPVSLQIKSLLNTPLSTASMVIHRLASASAPAISFCPLKPHQPPPWSEIGRHPHTHFLFAWKTCGISKVTSSRRPPRQPRHWSSADRDTPVSSTRSVGAEAVCP